MQPHVTRETIKHDTIVSFVVNKLNEKNSDSTGFVVFVADDKEQTSLVESFMKQSGWEAKHMHMLDGYEFGCLTSKNVKTVLLDCKVVIATPKYAGGWIASRFNSMIISQKIKTAEDVTTLMEGEFFDLISNPKTYTFTKRAHNRSYVYNRLCVYNRLFDCLITRVDLLSDLLS